MTTSRFLCKFTVDGSVVIGTTVDGTFTSVVDDTMQNIAWSHVDIKVLLMKNNEEDIVSIQILQLYRILIDKKGMTTNIMKNHEEDNKKNNKRMKQVR